MSLNSSIHTVPNDDARLAPMPRKPSGPPDLSKQYGRLRWARENAGYVSPREVAARNPTAKPKINENTYKSHEFGIRAKEGLKPARLKQYAELFKVNLNWLTYGTGDPFGEEISPDEQRLLDAARAMKKAR